MEQFRGTFESYGVRFAISSNDESTFRTAVDVARTALLGQLKELKVKKVPHELTLEKIKRGIHFSVDDADHGVSPLSKIWHFYDTCVRILVAEFAKDRVFIHCGVVVWKGKSILFPGDSYTGKTTLVAEFVRRGAVYYSDEYAILDDKGLVHPFARPLAIRDKKDFSLRYDTPAAELGGTSGTFPVPVDLVFLLKYRMFSRSRVERLSAGKAVLEIMPFAITLKSNPKFTLFVLNKLSNRVTFFSGQRGNSKNAVDNLIEIVDKL